MPGFLIFRPLLDVVKDIVDRLFGIISSDCRFDIREEFPVMFDSLDIWSDTTNRIEIRMNLPCRINQV
jgi:hypothetical protein